MNNQAITLNDLKAYHTARQAKLNGSFTAEHEQILSRLLSVDLLAHAIALIEDAEENFQLCWSALKYADFEHDEEQCASENHFLWCRDCLSYAASDC